MTEEAAPAEEVVEEAVEEATQEGQSEEVQEEVAPEPERPDFSRQFAAIAKKERALRQRETVVKGLENRVKELEGSQGQYGEIERLAKENPAALLTKLGISYEDLTQQVINEGNPTAEQTLTLENSQLRERLEKLEGVYENQRAEARKQSLETARTTLVDNVRNFVENDDQYDLVRHNEAYELVAEVMQQHYIKTKGPDGRGEIMEYSAAAKVVEDHFESEAERYLGSKKIQERWKAKMAPAEPEAPQEAAAPANNGGPKTLSNKNSAQTTERDTGMLSRAESLQRMAQMLNGE